MADRDAFGRKQDENTLAEMGWLPAQPAPVAAEPAAPPPPPAPVAAASAAPPSVLTAGETTAPPVRPAPRRRGAYSRLLFLLALLAVFGAGAGPLIRLGGEAIDRGQEALRDAIPTPATRTPTTRTPSTLDGSSLLQPATLRKAMRRLPAGRVTVLTVRPDGLDATVSANGATTLVHMDADGEVTTVDAPVAIPGKSTRLDPAAPARIVRTVLRRTGRDADSISQLVLANGTWTLQFPDGVQFTANAKGTKVRRIT